MTEIRRCPFCGRKAVGKKNEIISKTVRKSYHVECEGCGSMSAAYPSRQLAVEQWDHRLSDLVIADLAAELQEAYRENEE